MARPRTQLRRHYSPVQDYSTTSAEASISCPACSHIVQRSSASTSSAPAAPPVHQCPSCSSLLPPPSTSSSSSPSSSSVPDYFSLFSLPPTFAVSKADLRRSFLRWQSLVHPDKLPSIASASSASRRKQEAYAAAWSALVNEGYKTLSSDSARGEYMLQRRGVQIEEQDKMDDPELLMEILEVREALEEAQTEDEVAAIRDSNKETTKETLETLQDVLESSGEIDAKQAKNLLIRLRYQANVENVCKEWQPGKDIVLQH